MPSPPTKSAASASSWQSVRAGAPATGGSPATGGKAGGKGGKGGASEASASSWQTTVSAIWSQTTAPFQMVDHGAVLQAPPVLNK